MDTTRDSPRISTISSDSEDATPAVQSPCARSANRHAGGPSNKSRAPPPVDDSTVFSDLLPEDDEGAVEYKWRLVDPSPERFTQLVTQMKFRLSEGGGEAIYEIGVTDDGIRKGLSPENLAASINTLQRMSLELEAETTIIGESAGREGPTASILVRRIPKALEEYLDVRVAVAGMRFISTFLPFHSY